MFGGWLTLVTTPPYPTERDRIRELATQAKAKLNSIAQALEGQPSTGDLLEMASLVSAGRPRPTEAQLGEPEAFLSWVWSFFSDEEGPSLSLVLGDDPPRRFHELVTDGRPDLSLLRPAAEGEEDEDEGADSETATEAPPPELLEQNVDAWVHLRNAGDGHQDLFWDPTVPDAVRLIWTDNTDRGVIVDDWRSAEAFLREWFFPKLIAHHRADIEEALRGGKDTAVLLGTIAALFIGTILLLGLFVRSCT